MRNILTTTLVKHATRSDFAFLTGDLGFGALEPLREVAGDRFINTGIAEQNMISVASGLGRIGFAPWVYSIAPFIYARPFEQIRNDICLHRLPVCLIGNGGGYGYGVMGATHHALEDYGVHVDARVCSRLRTGCNGSHRPHPCGTRTCISQAGPGRAPVRFRSSCLFSMAETACGGWWNNGDRRASGRRHPCRSPGDVRSRPAEHLDTFRAAGTVGRDSGALSGGTAKQSTTLRGRGACCRRGGWTDAGACTCPIG